MYKNDLDFALALDKADPLKDYRSRLFSFHKKMAKTLFTSVAILLAYNQKQ